MRGPKTGDTGSPQTGNAGVDNRQRMAIQVRVKPLFAWFDFWVGVYYDRANRRIYILPVPMLGVVIDLAPMHSLASKHTEEPPGSNVGG